MNAKAVGLASIVEVVDEVVVEAATVEDVPWTATEVAVASFGESGLHEAAIRANAKVEVSFRTWVYRTPSGWVLGPT